MSLTPVAYLVICISTYDVSAISLAWFSEIRETVVSEFDKKRVPVLKILNLITVCKYYQTQVDKLHFICLRQC